MQAAVTISHFTSKQQMIVRATLASVFAQLLSSIWSPSRPQLNFQGVRDWQASLRKRAKGGPPMVHHPIPVLRPLERASTRRNPASLEHPGASGLISIMVCGTSTGHTRRSFEEVEEKSKATAAPTL